MSNSLKPKVLTLYNAYQKHATLFKSTAQGRVTSSFLVMGCWGYAAGWGRIFTTRLTIMGFAILYLHKSHNTPLLPPKHLHRHCFRFLLGNLHVPEEIANNYYVKFRGVEVMFYGICASREFQQFLIELLEWGRAFFGILKLSE